MFRRLPLLWLALTLYSLRVSACLNDYHPNDDRPNTAAIDRSKSLVEALQHSAVKIPWTTRREELRRALAAGGDYQVKNDLATALAHTGEYGEAATLLEQVEAEKPGLYRTAANLGTVYELSGDNQKALEWIKKGIERNAASHEESEWLHVRILEAKLAMGQVPYWLESHSILGPRNIRGGEISVTGNRGEKLNPAQIQAALVYQLRERLQFVQPPDAIVGDLLLVLGELVSQEASGVGGALGVFELAQSYLKNLSQTKSLAALAEIRVKESLSQQTLGPAKSGWLENLLFAAAGLVIIFLAITLKRRLERRSLPQP